MPHGFVEGHAHGAVRVGAQVDALRLRPLGHRGPLARGQLDPQGVEEGCSAHVEPEPPQALGQDGGEGVDAAGDAP